jgi:hypothetical protein
MTKKLILALAVCFVIGPHIVSAQDTAAQLQSPRDVVEQYWKLDANGAWLTPVGWEEFRQYSREWGQFQPLNYVSVLKNYNVGSAQNFTNRYGPSCDVEVDYSEWGTIDQFLNFQPSNGQIVQTYETLYLSQEDHLITPDEAEQGGPVRWRIIQGLIGKASVKTARQWVIESSERSNDPAIRYNAGRTLTILQALASGRGMPEKRFKTVRESASETGKRFFDLETHAMPDQWGRLRKFFVETPQLRWNKIHVVDVVSGGATNNGGSGEYELSTNSLGVLDSKLRLSDYPEMRTTTASACYGDDMYGVALLLSTRQWDIGTDGAVKEHKGRLSWRIEERPFEPILTLDSAIRYVKMMRRNTGDPRVQGNADRTLLVLETFKSNQPLPAKLLTASNGDGC